MRIGLVLGAGASVAQAAAVGNDPAFWPPLDRTFFERLNQRKVKVPQALTAYATDLLGHDPFTSTDGVGQPGMEEFFKDLFYDFVSNDRDERAHTAYRQLVSAYATVLRRTTNRVAQAGATGPTYNLLRKASAVAKHVTIVTFNHDLVIENVLGSSKIFRGRWCLRHGYGAFAEDRPLTLSKDAEGFSDPKTCKHDRPIRVHKLHGSLNWYYGLDSPDDDRAALRGERGSGTIRITRRKAIPQRLKLNNRDVRPVVVPPIYAKQAFLETFMKPVWEEAASDLMRVDRLLFFGYSLPSADIEAEKLFQRSVAANSTLDRIDLVNPSPAAASRYAAVFPSMELRRYPSLSTFLERRRSGVKR